MRWKPGQLRFRFNFMTKPIKSVLVADDNSQFRESLMAILREEGYEVEGAYDGEEAFRKYEKRSFDLVLLDIVMPNRGGFETMEMMLEKNPDQDIIVMTGGNRWVSHFYLDSARERGAKVVLGKPFPMPELFEAIVSLEKPGS